MCVWTGSFPLIKEDEDTQGACVETFAWCEAVRVCPSGLLQESRMCCSGGILQHVSRNNAQKDKSDKNQSQDGNQILFLPINLLLLRGFTLEYG